MVEKMMLLMMMLTLALPERLQLERRPYLRQLSLFSPTLTLSSPFQLLEYQTDVRRCRYKPSSLLRLYIADTSALPMLELGFMPVVTTMVGVGGGSGSGSDGVGGALEVVLVAAVVLWFVMVGGGGDDERRKSIPGSG